MEKNKGEEKEKRKGAEFDIGGAHNVKQINVQKKKEEIRTET